MLVTSHSDEDTQVLLGYLHDRGVRLSRSDDLRFIGRRSDVDGHLMGVVAYAGFTGAVCSIHCAGEPSWLGRDFLYHVFHYPFVTGNRVYLYAPVASDNHKSLGMVYKLGFKSIQHIPHGWGKNADLILNGMHKKDCRWLKSRVLEKEHE